MLIEIDGVSDFSVYKKWNKYDYYKWNMKICNILHVKQQQTENLFAGVEICMGDVGGGGGGR